MQCIPPKASAVQSQGGSGSSEVLPLLQKNVARNDPRLVRTRVRLAAALCRVHQRPVDPPLPHGSGLVQTREPGMFQALAFVRQHLLGYLWFCCKLHLKLAPPTDTAGGWRDVTTFTTQHKARSVRISSEHAATHSSSGEITHTQQNGPPCLSHLQPSSRAETPCSIRKYELCIFSDSVSDSSAFFRCDLINTV